MEPITTTALIAIGGKFLSWLHKKDKQDEYYEARSNYNAAKNKAEKQLNKVNKVETKLRKRMFLSITTLHEKLHHAYAVVEDSDHFEGKKGFCKDNIESLRSALKSAINIPHSDTLDKISLVSLAGAGTIEALQFLDHLAFSGDSFINSASINDLSHSLGASDIPEFFLDIGDTPLADVLSFGLVAFSAVRIFSNFAKASEYEDGAESVRKATKKINEAADSWKQARPKISHKLNSIDDKELEVYKWCLIADVAGQLSATPSKKVKNHIKENLDRATRSWWKVNDLSKFSYRG